jgi:hypothetical protein
MKSKFPEKPQENDFQEELKYNQDLLKVIDEESVLKEYPQIKRKPNLLKETVEDDLEQLEYSSDKDARIGHKSSDNSFFGYKTHLAMSEERIITAAVITSGEDSDGKHLEALVEKSRTAGVEIEDIIWDAAYSGKDNIEYTAKHNIKLVAKLNPVISNGTRSEKYELEYNKDAEMYVCKAGHLAARKELEKSAKPNANNKIRYFFDIEKCKSCPISRGCYKPGAKSKSYRVRILSEAHEEQSKFQNTEYFKNKARERYKIEAKNSELKNAHRYNKTYGAGIENMNLQGAITIFAVNLKRIIKLNG